MEQIPKTVIEFNCGYKVATNESATSFFSRLQNLSTVLKEAFISIDVRHDHYVDEETKRVGYGKMYDGIICSCYYRIEDIKSIIVFEEYARAINKKRKQWN